MRIFTSLSCKSANFALEGLLGRRRLVFTDFQVYFQCQQLFSFESMPLPPEKLHFGRFKTAIPYSLFPRVGHLWSAPEDIIDRIQEFNIRQISYDADTLNAIQGILGEWQRPNPDVGHLWGLPIFGLGQDNRTKNNMLMIMVMWIGTACVRRNDLFPSWSWAGWKAIRPCRPVDTFRPFDGSGFENGAPACRWSQSLAHFTVQFADGTQLSWEDNQHAILQRASLETMAPLLRIRAYTFSFDWITRLEDLNPDEKNQILKLRPKNC